jgi:hypothetical protein
MKAGSQRRVVKRKAQRNKPQETGQSDDLQEIADKLDQILRRSTDTEERLEKLERLRAIEGQRQEIEQAKKRPNPGSVFRPPEPRSRPETTLFQVPKRRATKSRDVTLDQIFESLQCLREEIAELSANHTEMVGQINAIKSLIH